MVGAGGVVLTEHGPGIARPKDHPVGRDGASVKVLGKLYLLSPVLRNIGKLGWYREVALVPNKDGGFSYTKNNLERMLF